ncbi:reverse transcriptase domain-containing protein [Tanacetum coccineum]|uniref:Reverse transcriptase domain-containing protein n=1 Tax=Tanacetum coccineum TaxID=301880 RepID=A0ABQ5CNS5_9ASTR
MIGVINNPLKRKETLRIMSVEEMIFPPLRNKAPSINPILISLLVYERQVGRVLLGRGVACDIIYEHCLLKLREEVRERRKDVYTTLSGFFGEQVSPLGEISLRIIVGEALHHRSKHITNLIVRSDSPQYMLFGRTAIVELGMMPSTMHFAVLYQSEIGPRFIMSEYQDIKRCEQVKRLKESLLNTSLIDSECVNLEEKVVVNPKYPEQRIPPNTNGKRRRAQNSLPCSEGGVLLQEDALWTENARATYQRLVDKVFKSQIRRNMEAYVDDMVIKNIDKEDMLADIKETFERLRKINMKLNPKKCSFGMDKGQFLGHIVSKQGIKANLIKVQALTSLKRPKTIKEVQSLNGQLASLNRFLAKSAKKSIPFFKTLKECLKMKIFMWTKEADKAFEDIKEYIEKLPTLVAPKARESLIVYLAASKECVSAVLLVELLLVLIHAARRLKRYFQAYKIIVLTNKLIRLLLLNPEKSGRMARWAIELEEHEI